MAAKIKDGLFIGDADSAGDAEFLDLNKIVNLGNLSAREVPNRFSAHGLVYLSLNWQDHNDFVLFDQSFSSVIDIVSFVDDSLKHGQSVLLFSTRGVGRCAVAACVYLMYKYR
jgi:protein-tyrosine phosphatase